MGGGELLPEQSWEEVCAAVTATLDVMTIGGAPPSSSTDPASAAATVGRSLTGLGQQLSAEAERLRAALFHIKQADQPFAAIRDQGYGPMFTEMVARAAESRLVSSHVKSDQCSAAFRAVGHVLAEAVARVAEADAVLAGRVVVAGDAAVARGWPGLRGPLVEHIRRAATHLSAGQEMAAAEDSVHADAFATLVRTTGDKWGPAIESFLAFRRGRLHHGDLLLRSLLGTSELAARAANLLVDLAPAAHAPRH